MWACVPYKSCSQSLWISESVKSSEAFVLFLYPKLFNCFCLAWRNFLQFSIQDLLYYITHAWNFLLTIHVPIYILHMQLFSVDGTLWLPFFFSHSRATCKVFQLDLCRHIVYLICYTILLFEEFYSRNCFFFL